MDNNGILVYTFLLAAVSLTAVTAQTADQWSEGTAEDLSNTCTAKEPSCDAEDFQSEECIGEIVNGVKPGTDTIRLILVGLSGSGKSSLGNSILALGRLKKGESWIKGTRPFISRADPDSVTVNCQREDAFVFGQNLSIVDTPGLIAAEASINQTIEEMVKCMAMVAPGPHAIILVVKLERFTPEVVEGIEELKKVFGKDCIEFLMIVFTHIDSLEEDEISLEYFVNRVTGGPRELLEDIRMRYVAITNKYKPTSEENQNQVEELMDMVRGITKFNGGMSYTQEFLIRAKKIEEEKRKRIEEEITAAEKAKVEKIKQEAAEKAKLEERTKQEMERRKEAEKNKADLEAELQRRREWEEEQSRIREEAEKKRQQAEQILRDQVRRREQEYQRQIIELREEMARKSKSRSCFSSDSVVRVRGHNDSITVKYLKDLVVGDHVQSYDHDTNSATYSTVYFITYQNDSESISPLRELFYHDSDGQQHSLRLHAKHLLYATIKPTPSVDLKSPPATPIMAEKVNVGDVLWVIDTGTGKLFPRQVVKIGEVLDNIRHPMTMTHTIIVDGALASVHMHNEWLLRQVTAPLRLLYNISPSLNDHWFTKKAVQGWDFVENNIL